MPCTTFCGISKLALVEDTDTWYNLYKIMSAIPNDQVIQRWRFGAKYWHGEGRILVATMHISVYDDLFLLEILICRLKFLP